MTNDTLLHPTDADLLAYLDGEIASDDVPRIAQHVDTCDACRTTFELFRASSSSIEHLLTHVSTTEPRAGKLNSRMPRTPRLAVVPRNRPSLRAAIIVIGLGAATLTVTPVRGWVVDFIRALAGADRSPEVETANNPQAPSIPPIPPLTSTSSVAFVPSAQMITIQLANHQTEGALTVTTVSGNQATGRITARGTDAALLVTSTGFRIQNTRGSTASYVFGLPPSISEFVVQIGDRIEYRGTRTRLINDGEVHVDLTQDNP